MRDGEKLRLWVREDGVQKEATSSSQSSLEGSSTMRQVSIGNESRRPFLFAMLKHGRVRAKRRGFILKKSAYRWCCVR